MKTKDIKMITDAVKRRMPYEHNWKLIEMTVRITIKLMEARPWYERLLVRKDKKKKK